MEMLWSLVEVELGKQHVPFSVFSQYKCFLKSDFHFIKRNFHHKLPILDAVLMTLIKLLAFTVYF